MTFVSSMRAASYARRAERIVGTIPSGACPFHWQPYLANDSRQLVGNQSSNDARQHVAHAASREHCAARRIDHRSRSDAPMNAEATFQHYHHARASVARQSQKLVCKRSRT
jgi:hypothetical protein